MKYLVKGGLHQRDYNQYKEIKKLDKNNARHMAFEHLRFIMQDLVVFKGVSMREVSDEGIISVNKSTQDRLKFLQEYGVPDVVGIYKGIIAPQPTDLGRDELVQGLDYLFKNKDDNREVKYHKNLPNGFLIKDKG